MPLSGVKHIEHKRRYRPEAPVSAWQGEAQFSVLPRAGSGALEAFRYSVGKCQLGKILRLAATAGNVHAEIAQCERFVALLASCLLALCGHSGGFVDQADGGCDLVLALPAGSRRFVGVDSAILQQCGLITEKPLVAPSHGPMVTPRRASAKDNPEFDHLRRSGVR